MAADTIYAVSSGRPPAAITILRISGPHAGESLQRLSGSLPVPRTATLTTLRSHVGDILDRALVLWFPAPQSATGEDMVELHLHGGVAVVAAVSNDLAVGLRHAEPGEFTRRAVANGRIDLNEAEGLADLLAAETETQRREAILRATGTFGREIEAWTGRLLSVAAAVEHAIDYDDGDEITVVDVRDDLSALLAQVSAALDRPSVERLREGVRVAIVGPPNAGKSSLFNALIGQDAAIVTAIPGTTRDTLERSIGLGGVPFVLIDTAGVRDTADPIERIGITRARYADEKADIVLDLTPGVLSSGRRIALSAKADLYEPNPGSLAVSAVTGFGMAALIECLSARARSLLPGETEMALSTRQRDGLEKAKSAIAAATGTDDPVLVADHLMAARRAFDRLTGRAGFEDLLDTLFSSFCLGK